jgi:preprotein translocase subunit SecB
MTDISKDTPVTDSSADDLLKPSPQLPMTIHAQYIKDLSFENPNSPTSLRAGLEPPKIDISINMDARPIEDPNIKSLYEVVMRLSARADRKDQAVFVAEVIYGAAVSLSDVPEEHHHALLLIEVPKIMFPYARKILGDLTQDGGYPPLLLSPVDFHAMYVNRFAKAA